MGWEFAIDNLRYALDSVDRLIHNVDAERAIITADHGNLFGEWSGAGLWGHPPNVPVPLLKRVPWAEVKAENTLNESLNVERGEEEGDLEEKLAALGYR